MIDRGVRYLAGRAVRMRLRRVGRFLFSPAGIVTGVVVGIALVGLLVGAKPMEPAGYAAILAFLLLFGLIGAIAQQGVAFTKPEADYLFAAPVPARDLMLYKLSTSYFDGGWVTILLYLVGRGWSLPQPVLVFFATFLSGLAATNLALLVALLIARLGQAARRLSRRVAVLVGLALFLVGLLLLVRSEHVLPGSRETALSLLQSPAGRVLLFPAMVVADIAGAATPTAALLPLGGLVLFVLASFLALLPLHRYLLESALVGAPAHADGRSQARGRTRPARGGALFRGPGALAWLCLVAIRRQPRLLVGGGVAAAVLLLVLGGGGRGAGLSIAVGFGFLPLWLHLPIGFRWPPAVRRELLPMPFGPPALVLGLLWGPLIVMLVLQMAVVVGASILGGFPGVALLPALLAYAAADATAVFLDGTFAIRQREPGDVSLPEAMARTMVIMLAFLPAMAILGVGAALHAPLAGVVLAAALVQGVVAGLSGLLLARRVAQHGLVPL